MSVRTTTVVLLLFVVASLGLSLWAGPRLPERVPAHWNAAGQVDGYSGTAQAMYLMPAVTLLIGLLLIYLPMIDPLRVNVDRFRKVYHWAVLGFVVYFTYMHVLLLLAALGVVLNMTYALIPAFALLFIGLGFLLERTQPNWFIGIRTPWTLSSPAVWEKTHQVGGWLFKGAGVMVLLGLFFRMEVAFGIMLVPIFVASIGTVVYSYLAYRQERQAKHTNVSRET
jgi:uncharacterized membrane protein